MEQPTIHTPMNAAMHLIVSVATGILAWINILQSDGFGILAYTKEFLGWIALVVSITAGIMAIRNYYYTIKLNKKNLNKP